MQNKDTRPLSPHLQIYGWAVTMFMSTFHRITGVAIVFGLMLVTAWLALASFSEDAWQLGQAIFGHWFVILVMMGWSATLFFHLCNGIRHLLADLTIGLAKGAASTTSWIAIFATAVVWVVFWIAIFAVK
ncbi:MAG: succinate dehydrogenase, cytochrome b556 subunit [Cardiobacteriaceae bacterium]|nr:succinate dehydrogenase, cytochrome b556 subunit [Cardiobacteriaceae bacterium]